MDVLTEQGVVRESDIFTLLFPRGYTPKPEETRAARTTKGVDGVADSPRDDTDATTPRPRIPPLKMLSPKTPRSLLSSFPMTAYDCTVVWTFVCDWVKAQVAMEAPAVIPGLGSVTLRTQALKIRIPFFEPDRAFMAKHGLRMDPSLIPLQGAAARSTRVLTTGNNTLPDQAVPVLRHSSDVLAFSYMEMAACCGRNMDAAKAKECLQVVIQKIGESMRHCERVEVDLGAGVVVCMNRVMESHMLRKHTNIQPTIDYEVRTGESIVKRTLQSIAATSPTSKKTKASFLTSSELGCAIQVNPAATESSSRPSDLFVFNMGSNSRRTRLTVLPQSTKSVSASPRTQQLQARLKKQSSLENDSSDAQKSVIASGFEPLFDTISRTFCVEPDLNLAALLPSNRIAANYTPSSASLVIARSIGSSGMVQSAGLIFIEEILPFDVFEESCDNRKERVQSRHGGREDPDHIDSERRYFAYLEDFNRLMDSRWLAPLSNLLVERIIASAIKYLNSNPTGYMREILSAAQQEFVNNYNFSVKKSILDYLMLRRASRHRLSIVYGTPPHTKLPPRWKWGDSTSDNGCMGDLKALAAAATAIPRKHRRQSATMASEVQENSLQWKKRRHKYVKSKLLSSLMIVDPGIRALHFMWYDFASTVLLIKLPSVEELSGSLKPMDIQDFENEQFKHGRMIRAQVVMTWYNRAKDLFEGTLIKPRRNHSGAQVDARTKHILDSAAVQMSLQVRSLVFTSVRAYVSFFELFRRSAQSGGSEDESNVTSPVYSGLLLSLTLQHGRVQFKTPLVEVPSLLLNVLHSLPQLFYNLNRIETQFSEPLPIDSSDSPFLWNTSSQEDEFVVATVQIREIIETNLVELKALLIGYEDFSSVFRQVQSAQSQVDAVSTDIATCQREIERIRQMSKRLITTMRTRRYLRLFTVDCGDVNHALLGAFNEWVARLLTAFAERTAHMNGELRQQYKEVAARIAKRPVDLYELVDAEGYIDYLKTSKLQELQQSVQEIKDRMRFLLFQQESATRVDEDAVVEHHCAAGDDDNSSPRNEKASPRRRGARSGEFHVSIELLSSTAKTIRWRAHIERLLGDAEASLVGERARIEAIFLARRNRFQAEIEEFDAEVKSFSKKGDLRHAATYVVQLGKMKDVLQSFRKQMESIVAEESKLQWKPTDFSKLDDIAEEMEPYEQLWRTAREFRELSSRWLRSNVYELQAQEGVHGLQQMLATITSVSNLLQINSAATAITAELIKKQMLDFRENTRLVAAILNPCMQERHLTEVSAVIGLTLDREEPLTLLKLLENGAFDHLARIVEISENATMEAEVAKSLHGIETEWQDVCFKFKPPKEQTGRRTSKFTNGVSSDMVLLKSSVDEIKVLVEDHLLRLQTLQCLRHAATFAMEISSWLRFLHEIHEVADLLVTDERLWRQLKPLFTAQFIEEEAQETKWFIFADRLYRSVVATVRKHSLCVKLVERTCDANLDTGVVDLATPRSQDGSTAGLLCDLQACHTYLERVRDNVCVGFEHRREAFPRFYFLSDADLVAVLACSGSPRKEGSTGSSNAGSSLLWHYLHHCFPGIDHVLINTSSATQEISALMSADGEQVPVGSPIPTAEVPISVWLSKLETAMHTILQACVRAAISDLARKEFRKWCLLWPEQVVTTTIQFAWSLQGEQANTKSNQRDVQAAWLIIVEDLKEKALAVSRELKAASTPSSKRALSNVIIVLQHLRDASMQIHDDVDVPSEVAPVEDSSATQAQVSMCWFSQPRFYYTANTLGMVVMSFAPLSYGFEYLGNTSRSMVVTPLTLRCFQHLAYNASALARGSYVQGPPGVGKRTTCQALSRLCGRLWIQLNSHQHHVTGIEGVAKFLKGVTSCGAWLCMEGLHKLPDLHELSLIGTICSQVMDSLTARHTHCSVLGTRLRIRNGVHFLVMASSVNLARSIAVDAARDQLRSFFRPVDVPVPEIDKLAEFYLENAKMLTSTALGKLIYAAWIAFRRHIGLLVGERVDGSPWLISHSMLNFRALKQIVQRAVDTSSDERRRINISHGFSPGLMVTASNITEIPNEMAREIERMEHRFVCLALRDSIGTLVPISSLEMVEFVLRDFASNSLARELRVSRSFLTTGRGVGTSGFLTSSRPSSREDTRRTPEEVIETMLQQTESEWLEVLGEDLSQKVIQLFHRLSTRRVTVVCGDISTGKTLLYEILARLLSRLYKENHPIVASESTVRPTRHIVVSPRALVRHQILGVSSDPAKASHTILQKISRDVKSRALQDPHQQTWLVMDGDLSSLWAEVFLQAVGSTDIVDEECEADDQGLLLSTGKRLVLPKSMRVLLETTALADVTPSFLTKVGIVNVGARSLITSRSSAMWRGLYKVWKLQHKEEFHPLDQELFALLDMLVIETLDSCLTFAETQFQAIRHPCVSTWRIRSFFALLHSSFRQSWVKLRGMVSTKQRKTVIHCLFLQSLVWGIGHTYEVSEQHRFHTFLRELIIQGPRSTDSSLKRVVLLYFPSGTMGTSNVLSGMGATKRTLDITAGTSASGSSSSANAANLAKETIYNFGFSVELGMKWFRWPEYYDQWLHTYMQLMADGSSAIPLMRPGGEQLPMPDSSDDGSTSRLNGMSDGSMNHVFVRTPATAAAMCLLHQLMTCGYSVLLVGPRDVGKTTCSQAWIKLLTSLAHSESAESANIGVGGPLQASDGSAVTNNASFCAENIYVSAGVRASNVLEQLSTYMEHQRIRRRSSVASMETKPDAGVVHHKLTSSTIVFIDDLHCASCNDPEDSGMELLRGIIERHQLVHPRTNAPIPCSGLFLFGAMQTGGYLTSQTPTGRERLRLAQRFVPLSLRPMSDSDLTSVCSSNISSLVPLTSDPSPNGASELSYIATQEATQLQSVLVKATIKLFRVLRSDKWTLASTPSSSAASSQFTSAMAFQPSKAHYLFHQRDILEVLKGVCCDTRVSLSFAEKPLIARLWCHESARVFGDRLSNKRDTDVFFQLLHTLVLSQFSLTSEVFVPPFLDVSALSGPSKHLWLQRHLHFTFIGESSGAGMIDGYREVNELHKVELSIERSMMAMYRANVLTESLEFVLCTYVIHHVMRLSRVLRRSHQHVLCVGQRGRKMLSITRLAVFICRKNVHVFNTHRVHRDAIAVWTTFLRSVVLQCLRQPDESAVLVIKDAWLECPELYGTIDQILGGYRLFTDIISYDDLDETVLQTLRNEAEREHERGDASSRTMYDPMKLLNSKGAVLDYLYVCLRRRLQVVLLFALPQGTIKSSQASWKLAEILWRYTHLQRSCTINYMGEWPEESLVTVAQKCLSTQFGSEKDRLTQLSQATVQVYLETQRAMGEWTGMCPDSTDLNQRQDDHEPSHSSTGPPLPSSELVTMTSLSVVPSLLVEQISLFTTYYPRLQRDVDATKSRFERGLEFIERTDQILALEQSQQQMLQPEMAKRTIATRRMSGNLEREKLTANKLTKALEMETALVESQRQRLQQVELEYDDLVREARLVFEEKQASIAVFQVAVAEGNGVDEDEVSAVDDGVEGQGQPPHLKEAATRRLRRSMIRTFIALAQVPTSLRQLAECYGLIFGIEPVEACDELDPDEIVMDYWESTTARMRDVAFWNVLASFDVRKYMNEKILARILPVCTAPDFDVALLSAVHEVAGVLCDWVKACALYSRDFLLAEPKYVQLCNERELFRAAVAQMNARQAEMDLQANTTSNVNAMRTLTEQERKDIEAKLKDTTSTLQMALSVWKVLESTKEKWRQKYEDATTKSVQMMGDVILATALIAYAPTLTARARVALRLRWCAVLNRFYVMHSSLPPRLLSDVFLVEPRTLMRWQVDGIPEGDAVAIENAMIVTRSYLTPVLVDPSGVAFKWVSQQEANSGLTIVSAVSSSNPTLWEHITLSVRKKAALMITDLTALAVEAILPVLQAKRRARFDYVNRDLSSAATGISTGFGTGGGNAGAGGGTPTFRRVSSVGMALGVNTHGLDDSIVPTGQHGNHRCWFEIPKTAPERKDSFSMVSQNTILECGSDSLRVYLVYSQSNDELPDWLTALASQLILIRFAFSAAHVQERAQQAIVEARHDTSRLMEIRTLRLDLIACDEQIETMENEMLDFFSVEDPVLVFSDTTKALKIVGNRSALHTLESSKNDSIIKIHQHLLYFSRYDVIVQRIIDVALTLRYIKALPSAESTHFSVERLWSWVGLALRRTSSTSSAAEVVAIMTVFARQSIQASESEVLVQLFEFMLVFNVYSRREMSLTSLLPLEAQRKIATTVNPTPEYELLARLVMLLQCDDDAPTLKKVCAAVTSKLLVLRPECIASHHWRALCYLAEKAPPLRTLITQLSEASKQNREVWRESLDLAHIDSSEGSSWQPAAMCDGIMRVCIVAALNRRGVLREIDTFAARELTWGGDFEVGEELKAPLAQDEEKTGESFMTKMATALDDVVRAAMHASPMPHSLKEIWKNYSKTNTPIVVVCYPATDFLRELTELAADVVTTIDMSCNEASSVEAFEKHLFVAMQKGHWVALVNLDSKPQWRNCIASILADTSKYEVHSDFRLWISLLVSPTIRQPVSEPSEGVRKCLNPRYTFFRSLAHVITLAKQHRIINTQLQPENEFLHQPLKRLVVFHAALVSSDIFSFSLWKQQAGVHDDRFFMALNALAQFTLQEDSGKPRTACTVWDSIQITVLNVYGADVTTIQDRLLLSCCADLFFHAEAIDPVLMEAITKTAVDVAQVIKQFDAMSWLSICENAHTFWSRGMSTTVESVAISQRQQLLSRLHQILEYHGAFMLSSRGKMSVVEGSKTARATAGGSGAGPQAGGSIGLALDFITRFATELDGISFDERKLDERYPRGYKHPLHQLLRHEITQMQQIQRSIREDITVIEAGLFGQESLRQAISIAFAQIVQGVTPSPWLSLLQPHSHSEVVQLESFRTTVLGRLRYFSTWLEKGIPSRLELDKFQSCEAVFQVIHQHFVRNLVGTTVCGVDCLKVQRIFEDRQHVSLPFRDETFYLAGVRLFGNLQAEILSGSVSVSQAAAILERKRSQMPQTTRDLSEIRVDGTPVILEVTASCLSSQPKALDSIGSTRHLVLPAPSSPQRSSTNPAWSGYLCPIFRSSACTSSKFVSLPVLGRLGSVEANITIVSGMSLPELTLSGTVLIINSADRDGL